MTDIGQPATNYYVNPEHVAFTLFYEIQDPDELSRELDISQSQARVLVEFIGRIISELDWLEENEADDFSQVIDEAANQVDQANRTLDVFVFLKGDTKIFDTTTRKLPLSKRPN